MQTTTVTLLLNQNLKTKNLREGTSFRCPVWPGCCDCWRLWCRRRWQRWYRKKSWHNVWILKLDLTSVYGAGSGKRQQRKKTKGDCFKGTLSRDFWPLVFHQTTLSGPLIRGLNPFCIRLCIRIDIRLWNSLFCPQKCSLVNPHIFCMNVVDIV
jgi:hypothetical protein